MNTTETDTPRSDMLESTRQSLNQARTPAYGDALRLCRQLERELNEAKIALQKCLDALTDGDTVEPCGYLPAIYAARAILKP